MDKTTISKEELIKIIQNAQRNSNVSEEIPIQGEMYVSPKTRSAKKDDERIKKGIKTIIASVAIIASVISISSITGVMDFTTEVRKEVNDTYVEQNPFGGQYVTKNEHEQVFRDYIAGLNEFELNKLYNETSNAMQDSGMINESNNIDDVVDQMEDNFLKSSRKKM